MTESKSIYKTKHVTSDIRARIVCGSHCYKHGSGTQREEMTANPQYQHGMQPVFRKSGVVGSNACSNIWRVSGSEDRGGSDNSIQFIDIERMGDKSFKEWPQKIGGWKSG